jgi:hypothetical protein
MCLNFERVINPTSIQVHVDGPCVDDAGDVAEAFAKHFYTTYSRISPPFNPMSLFCSASLPIVSRHQNAVKRLRPTKSVAHDDNPGFLIKGCSAMLVPVLKHIFSRGVSHKQFPTQRKQVVNVPVCKKSNTACVKNYRRISPIYVLSNASKVIELVTHDDLSYLLLLFTAIGFSPGGSSPYTSTHNTNVFTWWQ